MACHGNVEERVGVRLLPRVSIVEKKGLFSLEDYVAVILGKGDISGCEVKGMLE